MPYTSKKESLRNIEDIKESRCLERNTFMYKTSKYKAIRLHYTDLITYLDHDKIQLNTDGYLTMTSKDRLNIHLPDPYRIWQDKSIWYISNGDKHIEYYDNMILPDAFNVQDDPGESKADINKKINKFVKLIDKMESMPLPSNGDCWDCLMFDKDPNPSNNPGHFYSHFDEGYIHGTMIIQAFRFAGYSDYAISHYAYSDKPDKNLVKRVLRRYLRRKLGLPS